MYQVELTQAAARQLKSLPRSEALRIAGAIELLAINPYPPKAVRLRGLNAWRVRVGDYRIIYTVRNEELVVTVIKVGHRRDVYHALK